VTTENKKLRPSTKTSAVLFIFNYLKILWY